MLYPKSLWKRTMFLTSSAWESSPFWYVLLASAWYTIAIECQHNVKSRQRTNSGCLTWPVSDMSKLPVLLLPVLMLRVLMLPMALQGSVLVGPGLHFWYGFIGRMVTATGTTGEIQVKSICSPTASQCSHVTCREWTSLLSWWL